MIQLQLATVIFSWPGDCGMILSCDAGQCSELQFPVSHGITIDILFSVSIVLGDFAHLWANGSVPSPFKVGWANL